ncbi:MAG: S-methyl-5'-thioadenosine phosphorylase [Deltaproteobacteria bacterium]|nr:S-methyl-5'-thioadenosine phosphorylase [Deltaproteobacteria bacterium]
MTVLGVIGGSGLYDIEGLHDVRAERVETPWGAPSDVVVRGSLDGVELLFLPRHGRGHRVSPSALNYRANVAAMKMLGATHLVAVSAVGSMKEEIAPGDFVVVDQFIDLTKRRASTFFSFDGVTDAGAPVAHVPFAEPICSDLAASLADAAETTGVKVHRGGTYVCIEGPQFSTRAESLLYRSWGVSVIGMTNATEAKLAREAELPFATLALATDYDCWHGEHEDVSVEAVVAVLKANVKNARATIEAVAPRLPDPTKSIAHGALRHAVMTDPSLITADVRERYRILLG